MKGFKSTSTNPYTYTQDGVWKKGQYTFQAVVLSDSGYAFAFQRSDTTWQTIDLSWQVKEGSYSKIQWTFALEVDAVAFRLIANSVTGETTVLQPMLEKGSNGSTPIAHEEDLRGMDGDNHEFIFTRNTTGIAPDTPLSTQDNDLEPTGWTDNPQGVTKEIPYEFVSMREKKNGVWLDFSPPSLWAKWAEDGLSVNLLVEGHYKSHWEGIAKVVEIVGGVDVGGNEVVKVSAVFRKGEENIAATVSQSRGFQWYVNGVHLTSFDNQPFITLDETYGDGFADYVVLSYLVNSIREEERREIINISEGMDGIGEEFIFKANNSDTEPPVLPQTTDVGYQNDDHHGEWSDDPVSPTESNQFVWTAKRKKVGGIWEAFGTPSVWTRWVTDGGDAAYWELHSSAPLIYKDAEDASTSGVHTTITLSGRYVKGVSSQNGGYISVQPNGGVEDTPLISPREFTPPNNAGVDEYVVRLYDDDSKATLLDTLTVPIAFKGEKGVSAINIILSNESDALPASPEGVVSDYSGSGTTIRVFEGNQELSYGTGNGEYQVVASGSNISPDSTPTTNGNARVYGNASSMGAAATAVITFVVSGKTFDGESFSFDKVQNFTKSERGVSAPLLYLSASAQVMKCNPDNTPQTEQTISFEAKLQNVSGTATFVATPYNDAGVAQTPVTLGGTGNTRTLTNAQWLATYKRIEVVATLGSLTDKVTIHRLADGATGENVIVGFLTNENITLQANNAGVVSSFTSANGEFWVYDGTTKVTSGITFSKVSQTGCTAAITSAGVYSVSAMSADNATVVLRAVYGGVTIDKVLTLSKSKAGADGDDGDGNVHIYRHSLLKPATPTSGVANPTGWTRNPDKGIAISTPTNWTLKDKWYQSEELTTLGATTTSVINFTTTLPNQVVVLELWADGHTTYDYIYAGNLNIGVTTSNYYDRVLGGKKIISYDVPNAGNHSIQIMWRKGIAAIVGSNRGYFAIIEDVKVWRSTTAVINKIYQSWSSPEEFYPDSSTEETIYCLSKTETPPLISDSDAYIDEYIPLPCALASYRGDFSTSRAYAIAQVVVYSAEYYKIIKAVPSNYSGNPTNTEYFENIKGWTDNAKGATAEFPFEYRSKRKKSGGVWGAFSASTVDGRWVEDGKDGEDGEDGHSPYIDETTNTWWARNETSGQFEDTGYSPVGSDGRIPYPAGYWEAKTYTRDANYAPYVQHTTAVYLLVADSALSTDVPGTSNKWKAFNNWQAVFVNSLVAAFAKIGGAVFTGDTDPSSTIKGRMISERGVDGTANFQNYTGDSGTWQPKLMLDFLNGAAKFEDAEITGVINALTGNIGVLTVEASGRIVLTDPVTGNVRLVFSQSDIPLIADLTSGITDGDSASNTSQSNISVGYVLPNAIIVDKNDSSISFEAAILSVNATIANMIDYVMVNVYLRKGGVNFTTIKSVQLYGSGTKSDISAISYNVEGIGTGTYDIYIEVIKTNALDTGSASISASTLSWSFAQTGIRYFQFGVNGMMAFFSNNHWYFTELDGFDLRGKTNMPGVLLSGTVASAGSWTSVWGHKTSASPPVNNSTGRYTVYHGVGHTNYQVSAVANTASKTCHIVSKSATNFVIEWRTVSSSPALGNTGFDFQIIGNNYA